LRIRLLCSFSLLLLVLVALPSFGQTTSSDPQASSSSAPADNAAAQTKPADPTPPAPLPTPSMSGPLQTAVPHEVEGGKLAVTGILSGIGWTEGNHIAGDNSTH